MRVTSTESRVSALSARLPSRPCQGSDPAYDETTIVRPESESEASRFRGPDDLGTRGRSRQSGKSLCSCATLHSSAQ